MYIYTIFEHCIRSQCSVSFASYHVKNGCKKNKTIKLLIHSVLEKSIFGMYPFKSVDHQIDTATNHEIKN